MYMYHQKPSPVLRKEKLLTLWAREIGNMCLWEKTIWKAPSSIHICVYSQHLRVNLLFVSAYIYSSNLTYDIKHKQNRECMNIYSEYGEDKHEGSILIPTWTRKPSAQWWLVCFISSYLLAFAATQVDGTSKHITRSRSDK